MRELGSYGSRSKGDQGDLKYSKVKGEDNPADACTTYLNEQHIRKFMSDAMQAVVGGRADAGFKVGA